METSLDMLSPFVEKGGTSTAGGTMAVDPLTLAAVAGGGQIVASLFSGLINMQMADEKWEREQELFEKKKEFEFQKMYAQQPMTAAQQQQGGINALVNAWGGTRR